MGECQELFKDKSFIFKFIELCLILATAIIWFWGWWGYADGTYLFLIGMMFLHSCFYFFFPVFVMAILIGLKKFQEQLYDLIICIGGAVCSGVGAILLILYQFSNVKNSSAPHTYDKDTNQLHVTSHGHFRSNEKERAVIIVAVFELALMVIFIIDIIMNSAQKS